MNFYNNSIFWIEVDKVKANPFQPRKEFDQARLNDLALSLRQYGMLQPIVVTRREVERPDGGLFTEYELISGERRLRASKLAGLKEIPALIRQGQDTDKVKLELAIIENLQREDLNAVERAKAFKQLVDEFALKHTEIAEKVGKSREYVSNTIRLLLLPEEVLQALSEGRIAEGHTSQILMLSDHPIQQINLFKEIMMKKMTVREAEGLARRVATDKVRKKELLIDPEIIEMEGRLTESLGTRVQIEQREKGGKIHIDFFSGEDLKSLLDLMQKNFENKPSVIPESGMEQTSDEVKIAIEDIPKQEEDESYNLDNFSL